MMKFDFTGEELESNKKGILSPRQKQVLKSMAGGMRASSKSGVWVILFFVALGSCIILAMFIQSMDTRNFRILAPQMAIGLCFSVFAVFVITALSIVFSRRQAAKLEVAQLLSAEGVIRHDSSYSEQGGFKSYYVYFGKKRFSFADEMSRVFPEGAKFRVYYCKVGQIELIMSFERLA
jgi:lysylphosphatidylglycerol synthetase-like protein (DUF2156 family)